MNIYEIKNHYYTAKINLSRGANCISLRHVETDVPIVREPNDVEHPDSPVRYGIPILFPPNRISNGTFTFENRKYKFAINNPRTNCHLHGDLNTREFELLSGGEDFAVCYYRPKLKEDFFGGIHEYEIVIMYRLTAKGLEQRTTVTNCSKKNMPLMVGFHTTFNVNNQTTSLLAEVSDEIERDEQRYLPTGKILGEDDITRQLRKGTFLPGKHTISRHYKAHKKGNMYLYDYENHYSIRYTNSANMSYRMLFNGGEEDYICLEPQNCMIDCLNGPFDLEYAGFEYLKPGESETFTTHIGLRMHR
jgi:aldose 1-epimerase